MSTTNSPLLDNLTVLDLSTVLAGPAVGMFLAELGARVIKVEPPQGDMTRGWKLPSESAETDVSAYFSSVNWGKESIALDLKRNDHQTVLHTLAKSADIVLSNYKVGAARRLGADYTTLSTINPHIIVAEINAYGRDDERVGLDAIVQAEAGFTYLNGTPDSGPTKMPVALIDLLTAHQLKEAVLLALLRREMTGQGSHVSASLLRSAVASLVNQATNWLVAGTVPQRMGSDHPNIVPYGTIYATSDGHEVVIAVGSDRQFRSLCEILDLELYDDALYTTNANRVRHRRSLHEILTVGFAAQPRDRLLAACRQHAIPAGAINAMDAVFTHPEAKRALLNNVALTGVRQVAFEDSADHNRPNLSPPPRFNQHALSILVNDCALSEAEARAIITPSRVQ